MRERKIHKLYLFSIIWIFCLLFTLPVRAEENSLKTSSSPIEYKSDHGFSVETQVTPLMTPSLDSKLLKRIQQENLPQKESNLTDQTARLNSLIHGASRRSSGLSRLESSLYTSSLVSLVALNVADYFSTVSALKYDGVEEANPLMKPFTKNNVLFAAVKLGLTAYNLHFMKKLHKKNKGLAWAVSLVANFAMTYVVAHNMRMIDQARAR